MMKYSLIVIILIALAAVLVVADIITKKQHREKLIVFFVLSLFVAVTSVGLLKYENITGDDQYFHAYRILGIAEGIKRGVPFTKINFAFNSGYGYIEPVFYPRLFLWIPGIMVALGMNISVAYKILIFLINVAAVAVSYKCFEKISGNKLISLAATALYTLNFYRLTNIYIRASVGESLFIAFLPMVIYGIHAVFNGNTEKWYIVMLGATFILQSHIIGTVITAAVGGGMILCYIIRNLLHKTGIGKEIVSLIKAAAGVVALNLFFLIRIVWYIRQDFRMFDYEPEKFYKYLQPVKELFFKTSDFGKSTIYPYFGPVIGILFIILAAVFVVNSIKYKKIAEGGFWYVSSLLGLILITPIVPWDKMTDTAIGHFIMGKLQFCFRINTVVLILLTMALIFALKNTKDFFKKLVCISVVVAMGMSPVFYYGMKYRDTTVIEGYEGKYILEKICPTEYFMNGAVRKESESEDKLRSSSEMLEIVSHEYYKAGSAVEISNSSDKDESIEIPLFYYDGYTALAENTGEYLPVRMGTNGVINIIVPPHVSGTIYVQFASKWFFKIADIISVLTAIAIMIFFIAKPRKKLFTK